MAINKKLIHFKNKQKFEEELAKGNILNTSIVFILDTTEIYTHGLLYDGSTFDPTNIEASILNILDTKLDNISDLDTIRSGAALGATALQAQDLNNYALSVSGQINNINSNMNGVSSEVSNVKRIAEDARTKAADNESAISQCATKHELNTAIANLVDSAPETLNTLNELAAAISDHLDVTDALDAAISNKVDTATLNLAILAVNSNINGVNQNINSALQNVSEKANKADATASDALNLAEGIQGNLSSFVLKLNYFKWSKLILYSFTINGISYDFKEGMTWGDWVNSEYNIDGFCFGTTITDEIYDSSRYFKVMKADRNINIIANYKYSMRPNADRPDN